MYILRLNSVAQASPEVPQKADPSDPRSDPKINDGLRITIIEMGAPQKAEIGTPTVSDLILNYFCLFSVFQ